MKQEEAPKRWDGVVRINLQTGREFKVKMEPAVTYTPITFVGSHNKVLVYTGPRRFPRHFPGGGPPRPDDETARPQPAPASYYLVDAATGMAQPVKGEFRPLDTNVSPAATDEL